MTLSRTSNKGGCGLDASGGEKHKIGSGIPKTLDLAFLKATTRAWEVFKRLVKAGSPGFLARAVLPRIGVLLQHPPKDLMIAAHYYETKPPASPPRISIVTPTLNQAQFLEATIQSVLGQGYPCLEYIVQDGGSSDGSQEIVSRYRVPLISFESKRDRGQAHAINRGFRRSTGEIMAYLNSDDLLLPGALNYVADFFIRHPEVDVVYGHRVIIDERGLEIGRWVLPRHEDEILKWADYVPQETLFWRKRVWRGIGESLDENFAFAVDWDMLVRFLQSGARFARLPRFIGAFRVWKHNKTCELLETVGLPEMNVIRERWHGRSVTDSEVASRTRGYLMKHVLYRILYDLSVFRY